MWNSTSVMEPFGAVTELSKSQCNHQRCMRTGSKDLCGSWDVPKHNRESTRKLESSMCLLSDPWRSQEAKTPKENVLKFRDLLGDGVGIPALHQAVTCQSKRHCVRSDEIRSIGPRDSPIRAEGRDTGQLWYRLGLSTGTRKWRH